MIRGRRATHPISSSTRSSCRPRSDAGLTDVTVLTLAEVGNLESPLFPGLLIPLREVTPRAGP